MIVATIGHQDFLLNSMEDAKQLLTIINSSKSIQTEYQDGTKHYIEDRRASITISIEVDNPILTKEEFDLLPTKEC